MSKVIRFLPGGGIRKLHEEKDVALYGEISKQRASHVEPVNILLRYLFHLIRHRVTDESRMAQFTRWWPCSWQARIFNGPVLGPFRKRSAAIEAEQTWLTTNWILAEMPKEF